MDVITSALHDLISGTRPGLYALGGTVRRSACGHGHGRVSPTWAVTVSHCVPLHLLGRRQHKDCRNTVFTVTLKGAYLFNKVTSSLVKGDDTQFELSPLFFVVVVFIYLFLKTPNLF